jgi:hypothetical protein
VKGDIFTETDQLDVTAILDGIPGAYENAMHSLERAREGEAIELNDLQLRGRSPA